MSTRKKAVIISFASVISIAAVAVIAFGIYVGDYYRADGDAIEAFAYDDTRIYENEDEDGNLVFSPAEPIAGLIFYPGGKVEYTAYVPLMRTLAERGILCILIEMPFNLAIFDTGAAKGIKDNLDFIDKWYIGGHSLGGSAAAMYVDKNPGEFDGLILLAAYSSVDLHDTGMDVLSIYSSEDKVLSLEKYDECKSNLPESFTEQIIDGGCHAYFGMYGIQDGDGIPRITVDEQIELTANIIIQMVDDGAQIK